MVIDAFRTINPQSMMLGQEPRQTTSNIGHLNKPSIQVILFLYMVWISNSFFLYYLSNHIYNQISYHFPPHLSAFSPIFQALIHGLNRHYYSIALNYRKNELEQKMLLNLHKKTWNNGLLLSNFNSHFDSNEKSVKVRLNCIFITSSVIHVNHSHTSLFI